MAYNVTLNICAPVHSQVLNMGFSCTLIMTLWPVSTVFRVFKAILCYIVEHALDSERYVVSKKMRPHQVNENGVSFLIKVAVLYGRA